MGLLIMGQKISFRNLLLRLFLTTSALCSIVLYHTSQQLGGSADYNVATSSLGFENSLLDPAFSPTRSMKIDGNARYATTNERAIDIPNFENGGIMIFYHIYKTGGSTASQLMKSIAHGDDDQRYFFGIIRQEFSWYPYCTEALKQAVNDNKIVIYELHIRYPAPNFPTLVQLSPTLDRLRTAAAARDVPFFAYTILRDPVKHALSFFNFFHVGGHPGQEWNPFLGEMDPTEDNFLKTFQGNRQCHLLDSDAEGLFKAPRASRTKRNLRTPRHIRKSLSSINYDERLYYRTCRYEQVQKALFESLDWVGTTENLQNSTLPLISTILTNDPEIGRNQTSMKVFTEIKSDTLVELNQSYLSQSTMKRLKHETKMDQMLYDEARKTYRFP